MTFLVLGRFVTPHPRNCKEGRGCSFTVAIPTRDEKLIPPIFLLLKQVLKQGVCFHCIPSRGEVWSIPTFLTTPNDVVVFILNINGIPISEHCCFLEKHKQVRKDYFKLYQ